MEEAKLVSSAISALSAAWPLFVAPSQVLSQRMFMAWRDQGGAATLGLMPREEESLSHVWKRFLFFQNSC